ncbi:MAG: glycosyltransferase family 117 protein [Vulcanimicrobiaceae bacterium]
MGRRVARVLAFAIPFAIYALSAHRHLMYWDMGEFALVPYIAGIAHPTGFPLFVMVGWLVSHLLPFGTVAFRMSLLSALCVAGAAAFLASHIDDVTDRPWLALGCALMFSFGDIAWKIATRPDPHAMAILAFTAMVTFLLRWKRTEDPRALIAAAFAFGCGISVHPILLLGTFGIVLLFVAEVHRTRTRTMLRAAGAFIAGLLAYLYIPLRSLWYNAHPVDPTRLLGLPDGQPYFNYGNPSSPARLLSYITGSEYDVHGGVRAIGHLSGYVAHWSTFAAYALREWTLFGTALVLLGTVMQFKRDPLRAIGLVLVVLPCIAFAMNYPGEADRTRYLLPVFVVGIFLVGEYLGSVARPAWFTTLATGAIMCVALGLFVGNSDLFRQPYDRSASLMVKHVLVHTREDGIIVAPWTYATPIAYAAYVRHSLGGRILVAHWLDDVSDDIPRWLRSRPVYVLDPQGASVSGHHLELIDPDVGLYRVF